MNDLFETERILRETYLSYLRSPFRIRHPGLAAERDVLLRREGSLYQPLYLEFTPAYKLSGQSATEVAAEIGIPSNVGGLLETGLFPNSRQLYQHQKEAWKASREGKSVVVTSGTGSGKTECFLAPLLASIAEEMIRNGESAGLLQSTPCYWRTPNARRADQRPSQSLLQRPAAVRGLVMYPLNALVEDQLARLREACDSTDARGWFENHAGGDRIWFGRYTGQTPVSGEENDFSRNRLRDELRGMDSDWSAALQSHQDDPSNDPRRFFQDPEGSEMWSRWDMQKTPPDILITNYSMLNIMLMRDLESDIWAQTKQWLESDSRNVFHLVIDELHSYRGTAGSEIAFLLRTLLARLGVTPESPQVRILATSASIEQDSEDSLQFLADFFGRDSSDFKIIPGEPVRFTESTLWQNSVNAFTLIGSSNVGVVYEALGLSEDTNPSALASHLNEMGLVHAVDRAATRSEDTLLRRITLTTKELADQLSISEAATKGVVRALTAARVEGRTPLSIRGHLFFHAYGRIWACSNPNCIAVDQDDSRRVGKLYDHPVPTCSCGARVLELLICQQCGEAFLGGYVQDQTDQDGNIRVFLSPDSPDFMNAPDRKVEFDPGCLGYRVFWPSGPGAKVSGRLPQPRSDGSVSWSEETVQRTWRRAGLDCHSAELDVNATQGFEDGFTYIVDIPPPPPNRFFSAFPSTCPHCGHNWARRRQYKNLIRRFSGGFARSAQVLSATLLETSSENDRRTIVFTDSRSDAARLSTSIKMAHYKELLRTLSSVELSRVVSGQTQLEEERRRWVEVANQAQGLWSSDRDRARDMLDDYLPETQRKMMLDFLRGLADPPSFLANEPSAQWGYCTLRDLREAIFRRFIELGMNPGGPLPSMQGPDTNPWWRLLDSNLQFVIPAPDQVEQQALIARIAAEFRETLVRTGLQASSHRDFESLGFGFMWLPEDFHGENAVDQATATVIRILVEKNRWDDDAVTDPDTSFPREASTYLRAVDVVRGVAADTTGIEVRNRLGQELQSYRLLINRLVFCVPLRSEAKASLYVCGRCGARHLHASGGVCWVCNEQLEQSPSLAPSTEDTDNHVANYYRLLVRQQRGNYSFASFELTGQTTSDDRRSRQRRFQDVFLARDEDRRFQRVSLLSVTTTMEAGVDIGSLRSVVLGNMPPVRFNYQQRVGRCGRRDADFSVAVTLSRGRSHDDYYFAQPRAISSDRTPAPFVDVNNQDIALRVIRKEVLLCALRGNPALGVASDNDVHGPFGATEDWPSLRPNVESWISLNQNTIREVVTQQVSGTSLDSESLANRIIGRLVQEIDDVTADLNAREDRLGRHLAYRGLFPMFGFPTRVRNLYLGGLNSEDSVDRDMERAIGSFSPGSQVVWEDKLFTAIGCEHRIPRGRGRMERTADPLGPTSTIGLCKRCLSVTDVPGQARCSFCQADDPEDYREIEMCQPRGFFARGDLSTDYRERFEFSPPALTARLAPVAEDAWVVGNARLSRGSSRLYRVNDNSGNLFSFLKKAGEEVWFTQEAESLALESFGGANLPNRRWTSIEDERTLAIGQISTADSTIISLANGPDELGHLNLSLTTPEGRSAWLSAAYLLQRAAGALLDVDPEEFVVGVQESTIGRGQVFVTDRLENGSGYTGRISQEWMFQEILDQLGAGTVDSMGGFLRGPLHEGSCSMACYRCLMTYGNSPTHPLLDWRIGLDTVRLLTDGSLPTITSPYWSRYRVTDGSDIHILLRSVFTGYNVQIDEDDEFPVAVIAGARPLLLHHPLVSRSATELRARLDHFADARPVSLFRLIRAPWSVFFAE